MSRYAALVDVLDKLCEEAPARYPEYHPDRNNKEAVQNARSLAFLHLYLKAGFNLERFDERISLSSKTR